MSTNKQPSKGVLAASIVAIIAGLCCASSLLIGLLGVVGLSAFTPYFFYILIPALILFLIVRLGLYKDSTKEKS